METVTNIVNVASKAIWGEQPSQAADGTTATTAGNETLGKEPRSGELGNVSAGEPYDKGNFEPIPDRTATVGNPQNAAVLKDDIVEKTRSLGERQSSNVNSLPSALPTTTTTQGPTVTHDDKPFSASSGAVASGTTTLPTREASDKPSFTPSSAFGKTEGVSETENAAKADSKYGKTEGVFGIETAARDDSKYGKTEGVFGTETAAREDSKYGKTEGISETERAAEKDDSFADGGPGHTSTEESKKKAIGATEASHTASKVVENKPQSDHTEPTIGSGANAPHKDESPLEGSEEAEKKKFAAAQVHLLEEQGITKEDAEAGRTKYGHVSSGDSASHPAEAGGITSTPGYTESGTTSGANPTAVVADTNLSEGEKKQQAGRDNIPASAPVRDTPDRFQHDPVVTDPALSPSSSTQEEISKDESGKPSLKEKIKAKLHRHKD